jgi:membrane protein required for colicin V production
MSLSVNFLDCLIVLVIVVSAGYAAWRGFLWETLTIFAWVAAALGCLYFGPLLVPMARSLVSQAWLAELIAYAAVFLAVFIPLAFMSHRFSQSVKHSPIGPLDRAAGVAFGVVRGLVLVGLAYLAFTYFVPIREHPRWLTQARLLPVVQSTAEALAAVVPSHGTAFALNPPHQATVRQAPSGGPSEMSGSHSGSHDDVADLIRRNDRVNNSDSAATAAAASQKSAARPAKSYGAADRQALERLIETGGNGAR